MGLLVATMTQWLQQAFERLARGESPVFRRGHVLILGWTERTPEIVRELLISEGRVRRFLRSRRRFARGLHVVVMAEHPSPAHRDELRLALGERYSTAAYTLRAGDPLRLDHLERVAFPDAAAIVIPGAEAQRAGEVDSDTAAVKVLLSLAAHPAMRALPRPPRVVAEVFHPARVAVARAAWPGPVQIVCSDRLVGQLLARSVENPGLSAIVADLFTHDVGAEPYVASLPGLSGEPWARAPPPSTTPCRWASCAEATGSSPRWCCSRPPTTSCRTARAGSAWPAPSSAAPRGRCRWTRCRCARPTRGPARPRGRARC
jgi:hypothetical protein